MRQTDELIYRASQKINSLEEVLNFGRDCLEFLGNTDFAPVSSSHYQNYILPSELRENQLYCFIS